LEKSPEAFRTISEAADELDLPQHVLRFWETRFATIKPLKRGGGRRYYRPDDVLLLKGIRHLLYDQGFTIKGVQRILKDQGARHVAAIGNGGAVEPLPPPTVDDEMEAAVDLADGEDDMVPVVSLSNGLEINDSDRDRLNGVLRDLLECKRLLERARE
jgi:DNA-binding transcriptional MerR regulator